MHLGLRPHRRRGARSIDLIPRAVADVVVVGIVGGDVGDPPPRGRVRRVLVAGPTHGPSATGKFEIRYGHAVVAADRFVILASDGVWDELSSSEAVRIVARLLHESKLRESEGQHTNGDNQDQEAERGFVDVADLFVQEVLKRAAFRIAVSESRVLYHS